MIYLTTGANGAGKTLITVRDVRAQQLKENRPVYYHGFDMDPAKAAEFGWQTFDPKKWQDLPDGSICVMDECQNEFPLRRAGSEVPDYIQAIAQHRRRRGFDFWMICPHPALLDVFVRRLIDKPSWHRHLKRTFGADMVSSLKFSAPDMKCEEPGAGSRAEVSMIGYPKEVYGWYRSASLHTGKRNIPRAVWLVVASLIIVPAMLALGAWKVYGNATKHVDPKPETTVMDNRSRPPVDVPPALAGKPTPEAYLQLRVPRFSDFPHTAAAYDDATKPTLAPYPAACVSMGKTCKCYTQQATLLQVSVPVCLQIVAHGFFVDWQQPQHPQAAPMPTQPPAAPVQQVRTVPGPDQQPQQPGHISQADIQQALGIRKPSFNVHPFNSGNQGG